MILGGALATTALGRRLPSLYTGLVATRGFVPNFKNVSLHTWMSRSLHIATDVISSLQVVWGNWYADDTGEHSVGAATTITASIEYPVGTFTQMKFSGSTSGTIADGTNITSDALAVSIPLGASFYVRAYETNSAAFIFTAAKTGVNYVLAAQPNLTNYSTATDQTMGGTVVNQAGSAVRGPLAIIAPTRKASVLLAGDSRQFGWGDIPDAINGDTGEVARALLQRVGYVNAGAPGETAGVAIAGYTKRSTILPWVSHVINQYGINDVGQAPLQTGATLATRRATLASTTFAGKKVWGTTLTAATTTTDNWATAGNQTVKSYESERVNANTLIRAGIAGEVGYFDIADALETSRNSGILVTNGVAFGTSLDGVHETATGNILVVSSGVVNPNLLSR